MRPSCQSCSTLTLRTFSRPAPHRWRSILGACCAFVFPILLMPLASCGNSALHAEQMRGPSPSGFRIESAAFKDGGPIPRRFTCKGADISPALRWTEPPGGTRSFTLIVEDPDAPGGVWTHWVVYNLPARARQVPENVPKQDHLAGGGFQGLNSFGRAGYGGPCPPTGNAHRYFFRLYALDIILSLKPGAARSDVLEAAKGHTLARTQWMGRFKR